MASALDLAGQMALVLGTSAGLPARAHAAELIHIAV